MNKEAILAALARDELNDALEDSAMRIASAEEIDLADLDVRDRAEEELLDAARTLGCLPEAIASHMPGRAVWDSLVRPIAYRLVALERRSAKPARHWWWHVGAGMPKSAVAAMSEVAALVARFPEARARFEALVNAEQTWTRGQVRTLRAWLKRDGLALAAAPSDERLVLETPELEVSFAPPSRLLVDLLADRRAHEVPILQGVSQSIVGVAVAGAEERFAFALPESLLDEETVLVVPLVSGEHRVRLG